MPKKITDFKRMANDMPSNRTKVSMLVGEFIGTAGILFFGCMGCTTLVAVNGFNPALSFGTAVMFVVMCFGHISGAHFNPSVTVASMIFGNLPVLMGPLYIIAQYLGATAGYGLLHFVIPAEYMQVGGAGICATVVHKDVSQLQGLVIEFFATGALILSCCAVWDGRNSANTDSTSIRIGMLVMLLALVAGPFTCAGINPARSFGPAVFTGIWEHHWIFVCGPLLAGLAFSTLYVTLFGTDASKTIKAITGDDTPLTSDRRSREDKLNSV